MGTDKAKTVPEGMALVNPGVSILAVAKTPANVSALRPDERRPLAEKDFSSSEERDMTVHDATVLKKSA